MEEIHKIGRKMKSWGNCKRDSTEERLGPRTRKHLVYGSFKRSKPIWMQLAALLIREGVEGEIKRVTNYEHERKAE